jgi:hypothetical protein
MKGKYPASEMVMHIQTRSYESRTGELRIDRKE